MPATRPSLHRIFNIARPLPWVWAALSIGVAMREPVRAESTLRLIETWPIEVAHDADTVFAPAHEVWIEWIDGARERLDFAHFYASNAPDSRLEDVIAAIERAAARGVRVRWIAEQRFVVTYPETLERIGALAGAEVRRLDTRLVLDGTLHTKFMMVDGTRVCFGSQNFDWRALEHIVELGVCIDEPRSVAVYAEIFEKDWQLAGGADLASLQDTWTVDTSVFPVDATYRDAPVRITPVLSPPQFLPNASLWDLDHLVRAIGAAEQSVRAQMLSYDPTTPDGHFWPTLDNALRDAATRGVRVQLLVSHWNTRPGEIEHLQSLQCLPNVEVRVATVPDWSGGFVPFSRVIHAKSLTVDGRWSWVGTSNWSRGYFHGGRHHGIVVEGEGFAADVIAFFDRTWTAAWSETVDPARTYPVPRVGE